MSEECTKAVLIDDFMSQKVDILTFPSHFNVAIQIRRVIADDSAQLEDIAEIVKKDPLVSVKILQEASRRSKDGHKHTNLAKAILVLGFDHVKRIALMVAMKQLQQSRMSMRHVALSRLIWLNSVYVASAAHVITDNLKTRIDPEEAFMSGMMLNMGAFYLLFQAGQNPDIKDSFDRVVEGIDQHYLARTLDILTMFDMSPVCRVAVSIDKIPDNDWVEEPTSLRMVIKMANKLASTKHPWVTRFPDDTVPMTYRVLWPEIEAMAELLKRNDY